MGNWTNRQFEVDGMNFDAAIDWQHELHAYQEGDIPEGTIPVELYNCSKDWDIYMIYPQNPTDEAILQGIREWIDSNPTEFSEPEFQCEPFYPEEEIHSYGGYTANDVCSIIASMIKLHRGECCMENAYDEIERVISYASGYQAASERAASLWDYLKL